MERAEREDGTLSATETPPTGQIREISVLIETNRGQIGDIDRC
jgi:hypothetical protein